jgi:uncharacterized protein with FMN-binding domain
MDDQEQTPDRGNNSTNGNKTVLTVAIVAMVAIALLGYTLTSSKSAAQNNSSSPTFAPTNQTLASPTNNAVMSDMTSTYKDGTYAANGDYQSPDGQESINVTLTLKDSTIRAVTVTGNGVTPDSRRYQGKFIGGVQAAVVGKKINGLQLSRVSGASLTPMGFNDALSKIESQAKN